MKSSAHGFIIIFFFTVMIGDLSQSPSVKNVTETHLFGRVNSQWDRTQHLKNTNITCDTGVTRRLKSGPELVFSLETMNALLAGIFLYRLEAASRSSAWLAS